MNPTAHRRLFVKWIIIAILIIIADQASKWWVIHSTLSEQPQTLTSFLRLVYAKNTGAAFSFLADKGEWARWLLTATSIIVSIILTAWLWKQPPFPETLAIALVLGGAIGNLIDRWQAGYVVDFIDVHWNDYHWPAFNIADSAITLGAIILIGNTFIFSRKQR